MGGSWIERLGSQRPDLRQIVRGAPSPVAQLARSTQGAPPDEQQQPRPASSRTGFRSPRRACLVPIWFPSSMSSSGRTLRISDDPGPGPCDFEMATSATDLDEDANGIGRPKAPCRQNGIEVGHHCPPSRQGKPKSVPGGPQTFGSGSAASPVGQGSRPSDSGSAFVYPVVGGLPLAPRAPSRCAPARWIPPENQRAPRRRPLPPMAGRRLAQVGSPHVDFRDVLSVVQPRRVGDGWSVDGIGRAVGCGGLTGREVR